MTNDVSFGVAHIDTAISFDGEPMLWMVALSNGKPVAIRVETPEVYDYICVMFNVGNGIVADNGLFGDVFRMVQCDDDDYWMIRDEMQDAFNDEDSDNAHQWIFLNGVTNESL